MVSSNGYSDYNHHSFLMGNLVSAACFAVHTQCKTSNPDRAARFLQAANAVTSLTATSTRFAYSKSYSHQEVLGLVGTQSPTSGRAAAETLMATPDSDDDGERQELVAELNETVERMRMVMQEGDDDARRSRWMRRAKRRIGELNRRIHALGSDGGGRPGWMNRAQKTGRRADRENRRRRQTMRW